MAGAPASMIEGLLEPGGVTYSLLGNLVVVTALMTGLWLVSLVARDASIVDIFWGMAFIAIIWAQYAQSWLMQGPACADNCAEPWPPATALIVPVLVTVWGLRLSVHLARRNLGKGEDFRYVRMRERFGPRFPLISLFTVFLLQAGLAWVVALPAQVATRTLELEPWSPVALAGIVLWAVGLAFETIGDQQLANFKRDPQNQGQVMDRGLWRYTRHPNYFGDFCVWWGIFLIAASIGAWWTVIGPILMSILLIRVSGAGLLEQTIGERRPGYADYARRTSGFLPRPPRP